ncbi:MAG: glycosyltransferase family 4 protein [Acidimicrobiales bacterium]
MTKRIALVSPYALSVFGGVQEQALGMSRELSRRGHDVLLLAPDASDHNSYDTPAFVQRYGRLWSMPANGSRAPLTLSPFAARSVRASLQRFRPDVVHYHEPFAPIFAWSALRAHEAPAVATFHRAGGGPALTYTGILLRRLARHIDVSVAVSGAASSTIARAANVNAQVLYNGFEMERFAQTPRERSAETTLLFIGRFEARKGLQYLIRAVVRHNSRGGNLWRLVVLGDGPHRAELEAQAARDPMILFVGAASDAEKRSWLRRANVLVAPSTMGESFGMILLEGMASETSVVASDIDGYREAVGDFGLLVAPGDDVALERAISGALAGETSQSIAAAKVHAERWSMSRLMDEYEVLYDTARQRFQSAM